jgi:hypothetical protein
MQPFGMHRCAYLSFYMRRRRFTWLYAGQQLRQLVILFIGRLISMRQIR